MSASMKMTREYFKEKHSGKKAEDRFTQCCNNETDRDIPNKNNESDWQLIEDRCEEHLTMYSGTEWIEPVCCDVCGRLLEYKCTLSDDYAPR
jgi:hypothetical protein